MMRVGMIGLGAMGEPMARNVAKAGLLTIIWNRTRAKAERLGTEIGVEVAQSPANLAAEVDMLLLCVSADADVLEMINAILATIQPGAIVVDMSTVSSATAIKATKLLAANRAFFLDAPVSGGVEGAKNATLAMMVGGASDVITRSMPVLETMGSRIMHMGAVGSGQSTKAVNQIMAAGINQAVTEALAFAQAYELPMDKVIEIISGGAAGNWFLQHRGLTMVKGVYEPGFKLALHQKDLKICQQMARQSGVETPLLDLTLQDYAELIHQGYGDDDISVLYRKKRES